MNTQTLEPTYQALAAAVADWVAALDALKASEGALAEPPTELTHEFVAGSYWR